MASTTLKTVLLSRPGSSLAPDDSKPACASGQPQTPNMRGLSSWVRFRKSRRISASDTSEVRLLELVVDCDPEPPTLGLPPRFRGSTMMYPRKSATERVRPGTGVSQCGVLYPVYVPMLLVFLAPRNGHLCRVRAGG